MLITNPIYKIETESNLYIIDLSIIDVISVQNKYNDLCHVFLYLNDRKDPIVLSDIPRIEALNIYTTMKKYKNEVSSIQHIVMG